MITAIVTVKGQIVIPARVRRRHNIKKGTKLCIIDNEDEIVLKPLTADYFEKMAGIAKGKRKLTDVLFKERRKEAEAGEKKWSKS